MTFKFLFFCHEEINLTNKKSLLLLLIQRLAWLVIVSLKYDHLVS